MDRTQIEQIERQMEEDHRLDREALERLKRFIPVNGNGNSHPASNLAQPVSQPKLPYVPEEGTPLKHAVRDIMNNDPTQKWTNPKMLQYLKKVGFPLNAKKPVISVSQATQRLEAGGQIKLLKSGSGNSPNVYRGLTQLELAAKQESDDLQEIKE